MWRCERAIEDWIKVYSVVTVNSFHGYIVDGLRAIDKHRLASL